MTMSVVVWEIYLRVWEGRAEGSGWMVAVCDRVAAFQTKELERSGAHD